MNNFKQAIQAAFEFVETLPSPGSTIRPAPQASLIKGAHEGVFLYAIIDAIAEARAESVTKTDFMANTLGSIPADMVSDFYNTDASPDCVAGFAKQVIGQYGSAKDFALHVINC